MSIPPLLNVDSKMTNLSALSYNSSHYGQYGIVGYDESDHEDTASLVSATFEESETTKHSKARKYSTSKRQSSHLKKHKLKQQQQSYSSNRSHSKQRRKSKSNSKSKTPYIINASSPAINASNDNVLEQSNGRRISQRYSFRATPIQEEENEDAFSPRLVSYHSAPSNVMMQQMEVEEIPSVTPFNSEQYFFNQNVMANPMRQPRHIQSTSDVHFDHQNMTKPAHMVGSLQYSSEY